MAVRSDNSNAKNSLDLSPHTGGIVIDIGTGDGRFVSKLAADDPGKFYIGVDANTKPLEKPSMKATRKPNKGGLPNALFVQAAVEDLPVEFSHIADEIHIHFPWGSLLRAMAVGDPDVLFSLRRIASPGCLLEVILGLDPLRDTAEMERLGIPEITPVFIHSYLVPKYVKAGFELLESRRVTAKEQAGLKTTWAKRLSPNADRQVHCLIFQAT